MKVSYLNKQLMDLSKRICDKRIKEDINKLIKNDLQSYDAFIKVIKDPKSGIDLRSTAIWALGRLKVKRAERLYLEIIRDGEKGLCEEAGSSLSLLDSKKVIKPLIEIMVHGKNIRSRLVSAYVLSFMRDIRLYEIFLKIAVNEKEDVNLRAQVLEGLAYILEFYKNKKEKGLDIIRNLLKHRNVKIRFWSIFAVATAKDKKSLPILISLAKHDRAVCPQFWSIKKEARDAIHRIKTGEWPEEVVKKYK